MHKKKIIVIGAGAAGLMAAAAASDLGADVTIYEKNEKPGKKIYITGKGRCNYSNACQTEDFFDNVVTNPKFLYSAIYDYDQQQMTAFLEENGCRTKVERGLRCFPASDHASDVTRALVSHLHKNHVRIELNTRVQAILTAPVLANPSLQMRAASSEAIQKSGSPSCVNGVQLADGRKIPADAVIVATGGLSYPSTGSTGDGFRFAKALGMEVKQQAPALVPLTVKEDWPVSLQGLSLKNVAIRIVPIPGEQASGMTLLSGTVSGSATKKTPTHSRADSGNSHHQRPIRPVYEGFGEMMFTHFGVTGPLILTASSYTDFDQFPQGYTLHLDLKPALTKEQLERRIQREFEISGHKTFVNAIRPLFPERLAEVMARLFAEAVLAKPAAGAAPAAPLTEGAEKGMILARKPSSDTKDDPSKQPKTTDDFILRKAYTFTQKEIAALAALIKDVPMTITGTRGFGEAVITRGGISTREINPSTMEAKKVHGLYFAGEVIDVNAKTGGFNLQIAWSTGHLAGMSAAAADD